MSWRKSIWVCIFLLLMGAIATSEVQRPRPKQAETTSPIEIIFVQAPVVAAGDLATRFPQGSRLARSPIGSKPGAAVNLTTEFFAVADPEISFDGTKVLFTGKKDPQAHWQVWEMSLDGSGKRQITSCDSDCLRPAYLPREQIVFTAVRENSSPVRTEIQVVNRDGSGAHPISFGPGNFQVETVLRDGRILLSASSPLTPGASTVSFRQLYTLRSDGTALASLRCDHRRPSSQTDAAELDDGSVVFTRPIQTGSDVAGELAQIRQGAKHNSALTAPPAAYWSPRRLGPDQLIVARRNASARGPAQRFDLYAFDPATGQPGPLVYRDTTLSSVQAVPVAAHPIPRWYWSTIKPELAEGYFICLDSYSSADAPGGRIGNPIARVRVRTLDPATNHERSLGDAPVEEDGSFYVAVPPDVPVRFELLDAAGRVIKAQRSWIWSRPGEENGCVGCHEDKAVAPPNRWPLALRRLDTPMRLGVQAAPQAAH
jgi:hypothetical protein